MSIKDYALELGVSSDIILKKLKELGHKYNNENDYLDDEDIIILDNELGDLSNNNLTEELADKFEMEDRAEEAALAYNIKLDKFGKVMSIVVLGIVYFARVNIFNLAMSILGYAIVPDMNGSIMLFILF